ncbi:T9SS type A sorting domain-containing protein [Ferruginibacter albus]|uniref:T9SS type A sorting domain-containing protein n=1 Tax=Ferruginibacter albus TaxID=2875540 RepID=UPI001CC7B830|nr:T9SS type A sorting domain-containing protein [Ferruginibacter albus]UAY51313.1 T9SS type A sorting domain-containing protein [Ferruginibacter albus]
MKHLCASHFKNLLPKLLVLLFLFAAVNSVSAQTPTAFTITFTGLTGNIAASGVPAGVTVSQYNGVVASCVTAGNGANTSYSCTITPQTGYTVKVTSVGGAAYASNAGSRNFSFTLSGTTGGPYTSAVTGIGSSSNCGGNVTLTALSVPTSPSDGQTIPAGGATITVNRAPGAGSGGGYSYTRSLTISGTVTAPPAGSMSAGTLSGALTTTYGAISTVRTATVTGSNLGTNTITATAPSTNFEVSSNGTTFGNTAVFTPSSGSVSGTLSVRLKATAPVSGSYNSQNIALTSTGLTTVNISTGTGNGVTAAPITITAKDTVKPQGNTLTNGVNAFFTTSGTQNGETITGVTMTYGTGAAAGDAPGTYTNSVTPSAPITGTATIGNYNPTYVKGSITVTAVSSPVLSISSPITTFGNQCINGNYPASFTISGTNLTTDNVTVAALNGYSYSIDGSNYFPSLSISQPGGTFSQVVSVSFNPTAAQSYSGNIVVAGGGFSGNVTVTPGGVGVNTVPALTTVSSGTVTVNSVANLAGAFTSNGCSSVTSYGIEYSTDQNFVSPAGTKVAATNRSGNNFSVPSITGLNPSTTYYYRAYGINGGGTGSATALSFTTSAMSVPVATAATAIGANGFTANWNAVTGAASYSLDVYTKTGSVINTVLSENFSGFSGGTANTGGSSAGESTDRSGTLNSFTQTPGWSGVKVFQAAGATKMGTGSAVGSITTPSINLSANGGAFNLTFDAVAWSGDNAQLNIQVNGTTVTTASMNTDQTTWKTFSIPLTGGTAATTITFLGNSSSKGRFFLDNLSIQQGTGITNSPITGSPFSITAPTVSKVTTGLTAGTTYYYAVRAVNGASTTATSNEISVQTVCPTATFSYSGTPYCSTSGTASVTATSVPAGGTYVSTTGLSINATSGAVNLGASTAGTYTVNYQVTGCGTIGSTTIVVTAARSATINYANASYCGSDATVINVTRTGTTGGTFSSVPTGLSLSAAGAITPSASTANSYVVHYQIAAGGGCAAVDATDNVTIVGAITADAGTDQTVCDNGGANNVQLAAQLPSGANGVWSIIGAPNPDNLATAGQFSSSTSPGSPTTDKAAKFIPAQGQGTYTLQWTVTKTPCVSQATVNIIISGKTWTGAVSSVWDNAANWTCGVPTDGNDFKIPNTAVNMPVLNKDVVVGNLTIENNVVLDLGDHKLTVNGTLSNNNTDENDGTSVTLKGSSSSALDIASVGLAGTVKFAPGAELLKYLSLESGTTAVMGTKLKIAPGNNLSSGTVSLAAGSSLYTTDSLILASDINGTARVGTMDGSIIDINSNNPANVTVERYIPANAQRSWRLLSIPTQTTQTVHDALQEGEATGSTTPAGYGTIITSNLSDWADRGFDYQTPSASMLTYDQVTNKWNDVDATNGPLIGTVAATSGYFLYIRGDRRQTPNAGNSGPTSATTLRTTGPLYVGEQNPISTPAGKFGLIGNVYASAIDFTQLSKGEGIDHKFYVWDPKLINTPPYMGAYQVFSESNNYEPIIPGGSYSSANTIIQSGQAFFIHATSDDDNLITLTESAKTDGSAMVFRPTGNTVVRLKTNLYTVSGTTQNLADANAVVFNSDYSDAIDGNDAQKLSNTLQNFVILRNGSKLILEARQPVTATDTIFYNMWNMAQGQYQLQFVPTGLNGVAAYLKDSYLNTSTKVDLTNGGSVSFTVDANAGSVASNRFSLVLNAPTIVPVTFAGIKASPLNKAVQVEWKVSEETGITGYEVEHSADGINFTNGAYVPAKGMASNYSWIDEDAVEGANYYRVKSIASSGDIKYSSIVNATLTEANSFVKVYPNPVTDGKIQLHLTNQPAGKYLIRVLNTNGQELYNSEIDHAGGSVVKTINVKAIYPQGVYKLQVVSPSKNVFIQKIFVK